MLTLSGVPMFKRLLLILSLIVSSAASADPFGEALTKAALERTQHSVKYDGRYTKIAYPGGDVAPNIGVCTDVIIRVYRALGVDLQKNVHEDMAAHFDLYPSKRSWGLTRPDTNIDHRRVPNLQIYFARFGQTLPVTQNPDDYQAGDIVTWMLPGNLPHIGVVVDLVHPESSTRQVVHNIGRGPQVEDALFTYPITGHYRYVPDVYQIGP